MQVMRIKRKVNISGKRTKKNKGNYVFTYTKAEAERIRQSKQTGKNSKVKVYTKEEIAAYMAESN